MWFGTREFMQEIATPRIDAVYWRAGWEESSLGLSGHRRFAGSVDGHQEYFFDWGYISRERVRQITDYREGVHGTGPLYWIDRITADQNVLPQSWATPALGGHDARPLGGNDRPVLSVNPDRSQGYPAELATYTLEAGAEVRSVFVPIPPGHVGWVGVHGNVDAEGHVMVTPFVGSTAGAVLHPTILSTSTSTLVNTEVEGTGFELSLDPSAPGEFTLAGLVAQVLPAGQVPKPGTFISGQGHAGCRFEGWPAKLPLVVDGEFSRVQVSAKLVEVG